MKKFQKFHSDMNINNGSQNLKKFMKETFATRSVNFDFQGPIFRLFSHKVVRNCYLIFILHTIFFYGDILELTQANILYRYVLYMYIYLLQMWKDLTNKSIRVVPISWPSTNLSSGGTGTGIANALHANEFIFGLLLDHT